MIEYVSKKMFWTIQVDIRVNTVNCVGVMGKGIALEFKRRYPRMFRRYQELCRIGLLRPGHIHIWEDLDGRLQIINVATKDHWRHPSKYPWIEVALFSLRKHLNTLGPVTVALPALGCGNGGLDWIKVKRMIENALSDIEAKVCVFPPK